MYENHHIFGAEMAGDFLREFGYDKTKLELVQKCILNHRDSKVMEKQSPEEIYVADADSISHFDAVPSLFYLAYVQRKLGIDDGIDFVKNRSCPKGGKKYIKINMSRLFPCWYSRRHNLPGCIVHFLHKQCSIVPSSGLYISPFSQSKTVYPAFSANFASSLVSKVSQYNSVSAYG